MDPIEERLKNDAFAKYIGCEILELRPGYARATMTIQPHHLNGVGLVQGGALFTLADYCFAAASNAHDQVAVALDITVSYIKAVSEGTLTAEATEIKQGKTVGRYSMRITNENDDVLAVFQATSYRLK